ncbi:MAG: PEGA domain-containing protein [Acidobacteria bacterium]|nr:MAG: PEGA domain-containing protein [Acidobacteriota bacterium]
MRKILILAILWGVSTGLFAEHQYYRFRSNGYYFRPPRTLFHFRPDYVFRPSYGYGYRSHYGYPGYGYGRGYSYSYREYFNGPGYYGYYPNWVGGLGGTYSTYLQSPAGMEVVRSNTADLIFSVSPARAKIFVDGKLIGSARDYASARDRYMVLDGTHELRVEYPGYKPFQTELDIQPNRTVHLDIELDPAEDSR